MPLVDFHEENGATLVVAGTHQGDTVPSDEYLDTHAIPAEPSLPTYVRHGARKELE